MWVIVMFDLPTETPEHKKAYTRFRKQLLDDGFTMAQYSIYWRHCASMENALVHIARMGAQVPPSGEVRFMSITDRQFSLIRTFVGKSRQPTPISPSQLELF